MFGHVLRMPENTPAQMALEFAVIGAKKYKGRRGRHCTNLLSKLRSDLKESGLGTLKTAKQLRELRASAGERARWMEMMKD